MKIQAVSANARRKTFEVRVPGKRFVFPYAKCAPAPSAADPVMAVAADPELAKEAFTYRLKSGQEGTIHVEQVLDYNKDPSYLRDLLLYELTLEAQKRMAASNMSKREVIRQLGTSAAQFYRLLDQTNYHKTIDQLLRLLSVLECDVRFFVQAKSA